jgi:hypothetical protein
MSDFKITNIDNDPINIYNTGQTAMFNATKLQNKDISPNPVPTSNGNYLYWNADTSSWTVGKNNVTLGNDIDNDSNNTVSIGNQNIVGANSDNSIAIGYLSNVVSNSNNSISIGNQVGVDGSNSIRIGSLVSTSTSGYSADDTIVIGKINTDTNERNLGSIFLGNVSIYQNQGTYAIAIGNNVALRNQGTGAICIGSNSNGFSQGQHSIAIGRFINNGLINQPQYSLVLNATNTTLNATNQSSFYVKPIRNVAGSPNLVYDNTSGEITYDSSSIRYKSNVKNIEDEIDTSKIFELQAKSYLHNNTKNRIGFIAEEVAEVSEYFMYRNENNEPEGLEYNQMLTCLIQECKKLKEELNNVNNRLNLLENK